MTFLPFAKTILRSLTRKYATQAYPRAPMPKAPIVRGQVGIDVETCVFCGICSKKCPTGAIRVDRAAKEWEIGRHGCIVCGACVELCPKKCLHMSPELTPPSVAPVKDTVSAGA